MATECRRLKQSLFSEIVDHAILGDDHTCVPQQPAADQRRLTYMINSQYFSDNEPADTRHFLSQLPAGLNRVPIGAFLGMLALQL